MVRKNRKGNEVNWQSFRARKYLSLRGECSHTYEELGKHQALVKVIHPCTNDMNRLLEVEV